MASRYYIVDLDGGNTTSTDDLEIAMHYAVYEQYVVISTEKNVVLYHNDEDEIKASTK